MSRQLTNQNLLFKMNPGFEKAPAGDALTTSSGRWIDGTSSGSAADNGGGSGYHWFRKGSVSTSGAKFDAEEAHSGNYSMKISSVSAGSWSEVQTDAQSQSNQSLRFKGIWVKASTDYVGTVWMKTDYTSGDATNGAFVNFAEYGATGDFLANNESTKIKTTTGWTQYTVSFTTSAGTVFLLPRLIIYGHQGAATLKMDAWFDDLELYPATTVVRSGI